MLNTTELQTIFKAGEKSKFILQTINNKFRKKIIEYLNKNESAGVSEMEKKFEWPQSVISLHLAELRKHGIVNVLPQGRFRIYSLNTKNLRLYFEILSQLNSVNEYAS